MELSREQVRKFEERGFLFVPGLLSEEEMAIVRAELPGITAGDRPELVYEKDGTTLRSLFNMHAYNDVFARLVRHPKLVEPAGQLVGGPVYIFQIVLNFKKAMTGDHWPWHQDYPTYHFDDGIPEPRMVNVLLFVEESNEFNGPLMLVPGSHEKTLPLPDISTMGTSYPGRWLDGKVAGELAAAGGIVAPKGPPGSVIFAHTNIVHGSGPNMSPWGRGLISLTLNSVENKSTGSRRPDFIVPSDQGPIEPLAEDCLLAP